MQRQSFSPVARGRYETFIDDPRWRAKEDGSRTLSIYFGDEEDGLAVFGLEVPPTYKFPAHYHKSHYLTIILRGSMRVGRTWYNPGDIRIQEKGAVYGPEEAGPDGCLLLNIFSDRRGAYPSLLGAAIDYPTIVPDITLRHVWNMAAEQDAVKQQSVSTEHSGTGVAS
jgi:hypothetical protein